LHKHELILTSQTYETDILECYGFSVDRKSKETILDQFGKGPLNICKDFNMYILYGRSNQDVYVRRYVKATFRENFVVNVIHIHKEGPDYILNQQLNFM
jgi:hypothetical protein